MVVCMCLAFSRNVGGITVLGLSLVCCWPFSLVESGCFIGMSPPLSFERPALLGLSLAGTLVNLEDPEVARGPGREVF